uniref:Uncharacterized protein n=1 Tax=Setaria italica TaxID=4555 RepID=K3ZYN9_SETIT
MSLYYVRQFWTNYELAHGLYILAARVLQKIMGVHLYTHVPLLRPPLDLQELPHAGGDLRVWRPVGKVLCRRKLQLERD